MSRIHCLFLTSKILYRIEPWSVVLFYIGSILNVLLFISELFLVKYIVDAFQQWSAETAYHTIIKTVILLGGILYLQGIVGTVTAMSMSRINEVSLYEQERLILDKTMKLKLIDIESPLVKDIRFEAQRVSLIDNMLKGMNYLSSMLQVLILAYLVTFLGHWLLSLIALLAFVLQMSTQSKASGGIEKIIREQATSRRFSSYLVTLLTDRISIKELRIFHAASYLKQKWLRLQTGNMTEVLKGSVKGELINILPSLIMIALSGFVAAAIVALLGYKGESAGQFTLLFTAMTTLFTQMPALARLHGELRTNSIVFKKLNLYLNIEEESSCGKVNEAREESSISINVKNLSFTYPDSNKPSLDKISFNIRSGQTVAIVGENGSGKSTLLKLLLGLYEPNNGEISWKSNDNYISSIEGRRATRVVFQEFLKLLRSVRENVALGDIKSINCDEKIENALNNGDLTGFINFKDDQLGPQFGGRDLSGGQWQRLAMARAYFRDSICTVFDEPTSALDAQSELEMFKKLFELTKDQTTIIVTHRLSSVRFVDWILVMKDGKLVEEGSHTFLISQGGEYTRIYNLQSSWYE
ncbi:ABC transporter ATP-binding protein [Paenibacillus polymyxa]|uniref:ATP-binding cassette domain-containing protein n=1 Tax=Paenibacillus polymyxa TaxID=1406 RepID=UPI001BEAAB07|nr:ABC transporter ATP-binding protein [Paenibacillus polymyxa]MBT2282961.1 ABC transporter ATP-binding protein [Paenibacillus polymyxa]